VALGQTQRNLDLDVLVTAQMLPHAAMPSRVAGGRGRRRNATRTGADQPPAMDCCRRGHSGAGVASAAGGRTRFLPPAGWLVRCEIGRGPALSAAVRLLLIGIAGALSSSIPPNAAARAGKLQSCTASIAAYPLGNPLGILKRRFCY
jgi:hypothetical protein